METKSTARQARSLDPRKRRAILEAAQSVFLCAGFSDSSMDDVARAAGVGKMTVYRHFGSKEALFEAMLVEVCTAMFPQTPLPPGTPLGEELRILGRSFIALITDPKRMSTYRLAMAEAERFPLFSRTFYQGAVLVVLNHVTSRLLAHVPDLPLVEARRVGAMFLSMVEGPGMLRLMLGVPAEPWNDDFDRQIAEAADWAVHRIAEDQPPQPA
ncbi:MAG: hypothetical protein RLY86_3114 [Pseudomonadota bacterium]|jgi:TetR/AcrR family transcriptional repressor of mexJK operon